MTRRRQSEEAELELLDFAIAMLADIRDSIDALVALLSPPFATTAVLSIGGPMANAVLTFKDAAGNAIAPPKGDGSGLVVTFASDNPAVTIGSVTASGDTAVAPITGTAAFNLSATVANVSGAPLLDDDGATPFTQPSTFAVAPPVDQAVTATLSVE